MERIGHHYLPDEVLPFVQFVPKVNGALAEQLGQLREYDGDLINMTSDRLKTFQTHGLACSTCGIVGAYFVKERHRGDRRFHFNLYAVRPDGVEVLMTKDRIEGDTVLNYSTLCADCRRRRGK